MPRTRDSSSGEGAYTLRRTKYPLWLCWILGTATILLSVIALGGLPASARGASFALNLRQVQNQREVQGAIDQFPLPSDDAWPQAIAADENGNLWFAEVGIDQVGRLATAQATPGASNGMVEYPLSMDAWPQGMSIAPDGSAWVAELVADGLAVVSPGGVVTEYLTLEPGTHPIDVAVDHDGSVWFAASDGNALGRFWPLTTTVEAFPLPVEDGYPVALSLDRGGNMWFAAASANEIGVYRPQEITITMYTIPTEESYPSSLVVDTSGVVWFTEALGNKLARLEPGSGQVLEYDIPTVDASPKGLAGDSSGRLWLAETMADKVAMFDPVTQAFTEYQLASGAAPESVAALDDGSIWFTQSGANSLGRITSSAPPTATVTATASRTATATVVATPSRTKTPPTATPTTGALWRVALPVILK